MVFCPANLLKEHVLELTDIYGDGHMLFRLQLKHA
jgi:hypothetical protein